MKLFVEYTENPTVIATRIPRFSWRVPLEGRSRSQRAYRIRVATSVDKLEAGFADLWDSGRVVASTSVNVPYAGTPLTSHLTCYWQVQLWDESDRDLGLSPIACFSTPLFDQSDWSAKWIGMGAAHEPVFDPYSISQSDASEGLKLSDEDMAELPEPLQRFEQDLRSPMLRRTFTIQRPIRDAKVYVSGLGLYELRLNGEKVGQDVLATPRTDFHKRVFYQTYDVTQALQQGENAIGIMLGNGWYNGQKKHWHWQSPWYGSSRALVQLMIEFEDGSTQCVVSDGTWHGAWSPVTFSCIYDGEDYDARLDQAGWDSAGFDDADWQAVNEVSPPGGRLVAMNHEANRVMERVRPVAMTEPQQGVFVFDMGKVMTGWCKLTLRDGLAGEQVTLRYAELQHDDGMINPSTGGGARQADVYTMRGDALETYEPRFTYHGFRYVEVTGLPQALDVEDIEGCFVYNGVQVGGAFECGHDLINKIHTCTVQSQRCNLQMGVPTDDTQREERLGWCGDAWSYAQSCFYSFDTAQFWTKWIADFYDQQDEASGLVGYICPLPGFGEDLVWSAAMVLIPWWQYIHYGDHRILDDSYPYLKKYMAYLERTGLREIPPLKTQEVSAALFPETSIEDRVPASAEHGYLQRSRFGDHLATHEGSSGFCKDHPRSMATAFYYNNARVMAQISKTLGYAADTDQYSQLAEKVKRAFNEYFFDQNLGYYDIGCQSAQALALSFGLVEDADRGRVEGYLCSSVNFRQRRITSGYAGTKWVIQAIADAGRPDIIWNRAIATDYPSWGYMLRGDKTTIAENWAGAASQCHTTLGAAIDEWFYWGLAGIRPDVSKPGFEHIVFKPYLPLDLPFARATLRTMRGEITSAWEHDRSRATWDIEVPANSTATVHVPCGDPAVITEQDMAACDADSVTFDHANSTESIYRITSGSYVFQFPIKA